MDGALRIGDRESFVRDDGTTFPVEYVVVPVRHRGPLTGAVLTSRDISLRLRAERQAAATLTNATNARHVHGRFVLPSFSAGDRSRVGSRVS